MNGGFILQISLFFFAQLLNLMVSWDRKMGGNNIITGDYRILFGGCFLLLCIIGVSCGGCISRGFCISWGVGMALFSFVDWLVWELFFHISWPPVFFWFGWFKCFKKTWGNDFDDEKGARLCPPSSHLGTQYIIVHTYRTRHLIRW